MNIKQINRMVSLLEKYEAMANLPEGIQKHVDVALEYCTVDMNDETYYHINLADMYYDVHLHIEAGEPLDKICDGCSAVLDVREMEFNEAYDEWHCAGPCVGDDDYYDDTPIEELMEMMELPFKFEDNRRNN